MANHILGNGVYSFSEAARLTRVSSQAMRNWFLGRRDRFLPVMRSDYEDHTGPARLISFHDLIDALVLACLRKFGVSIQYLRRVRDALAKEFGTEHPFCWKNLLTDGESVFVHWADDFGHQKMTELLTHQHAFPDVLRPYLKQVEYDPTTLLADKWKIHQGVVSDPKRQYGKPIVEASGVQTAVLNAAYQANERDAALVADWYGLNVDAVLLAVDFEDGLGRGAA